MTGVAPAGGGQHHRLGAQQFCLLWWAADHAKSEAAAAIAAKALEAARPQWRVARAAPGVWVMSAASPALRSTRGDLLFGEAFARTPSGCSRAVSSDRFEADCAREEVEEAWTISRYWGRYAAILPCDGGLRVIRDPSGAIPVLRARMRGVDLVFSDARLAFDLDIDERTIDWGYVAARLLDNRVLTCRTGLTGVKEVEPGACLTLGAGLPRVRRIWSLEGAAAPSVSASAMTATEARRRLRHAVDDATAALCSTHRSVALRLSGGFDSTTVAASLASPRGPDIHAYNLATAGQEGDERAYAQAMADHLDAPLAIYRLNADVVDLASYAAGGVDAWRMRAPRPPLWIANQERDAADRVTLEDSGATAVFSGRGGDNVFFRCEHVWPAVDRVEALGWSAASIGYARDTARRTGRSFWSVLQEAAGRRRTAQPGVRMRPGITEKARDLAATLSEPQAARILPPGKSWHIELLDDRLNYVDLTPECDVVHPLVSQPVMEACLAIPSWLLASGERDRGLARAAFEARLPPVLRARRTKGRTSGYLSRLVWRNRAHISDWLVGGRLAEAGLLDAGVVPRMLEGAAVGRAEGEAADLVAWSGLELWLRAAMAAH